MPKGTNHAFPLWFFRVTVSSDRHFFRKRPPIEMIEMIEMIEVIEMIWGSGGGGCAFWCGSGGGVELVIS